MIALVCGSAVAENWPQWRGPRGDGISLEKGIPTQWSPTQNIVWKTEIPGEGHSSPVVWEKDIYLTTGLGDGHERALVRVDAATGKVEWVTTVAKSKDLEHLNPENNYASSTPATDGEKTYTSFYASGKVNLAALDRTGKIVWQIEPLKSETEHGYSYTPLLKDKLLFYSLDQLKDNTVLAVETDTGKIKWREDRKAISCSHVPPSFIEAGGLPQVIVNGNGVTRSFDPTSGKLIWSCDGPTNYSVAGLAYGKNIVLASGGYPKRRVIAIHPDGQGDVTKTHLAWETIKGTTYVPSPVYDNGFFYSVTDNGIASCTEAETGKVTWERHIPGHFRSSLILIEGNFFTTNDEGTTTIFKSDPSAYKEIAVNKMDEFCFTTFAVSGGRLYMRTKKNLYCIGSK